MISTTIEKVLNNRVLTHILFWLSTLIIFPIYALSYQLFFLAAVILKLFLLLVQIPATYYLLYYQFPQFLYKKKYLRFFVSLLLSALFFTTMLHLIKDLLMTHVLKDDMHTTHTFVEIIQNPFANIGYNGEELYLTVFIVGCLKVIKQRMEEKRQMEVLKKEKVQAELKLLKAQVHPRILSKTLHQLHALTLQKSDAAPELVITLSDMLDYMLYQCNAPNVLILKEIELLQNYLDLEKLRYGDTLTISFYHELENEEAMVSPLLLLSIVEGVFLNKEKKITTNASVTIQLKEKNNHLSFSIYSNLDSQQWAEENTIRKQLALLYPEQYDLTIKKTAEFYTLNLELSSNTEIIKP